MYPSLCTRPTICPTITGFKKKILSLFIIVSLFIEISQFYVFLATFYYILSYVTT